MACNRGMFIYISGIFFKVACHIRSEYTYEVWWRCGPFTPFRNMYCNLNLQTQIDKVSQKKQQKCIVDVFFRLKNTLLIAKMGKISLSKKQIRCMKNSYVSFE